MRGSSVYKLLCQGEHCFICASHVFLYVFVTCFVACQSVLIAGNLTCVVNYRYFS